MQEIFKYIDGMSVLGIIGFIAGVTMILCYIINIIHDWFKIWIWKRKHNKRFYDRIF